MKPGLLILPFISLLIGALGVAVGSSFPDVKWVSYAGGAFAMGILAIWGALDAHGFVDLFRRKGAKYGASSGFMVLLGISCVVGIAALSVRPRFNKSFDVTRDKLNTLSKQSIAIIKNLKENPEKIQITAYLSDEKVNTDFRDLVRLYEAAGADFVVNYVDPRVDPKRAMLEKITEANTVVFKRGQQEKRLTMFNEEKFTNALINVLKSESKKIYFTKGHGEGQIKSTEAAGVSTLVAGLEGDKYRVEELSLIESAKVPDDAKVVVVAGPKYDFKEEEARILDEFMGRGGAVFLMVPAAVQVPTLGKLIEKYGVHFESDLLILPPELAQTRNYAPNSVVISDFDAMSPVTKDFAAQSAVAVQLKFARSLFAINDNPRKFKVSLVAKTHDVMWRIDGVKTSQDLEDVPESRISQGSRSVMAVSVGKAGGPEMAANDTKGQDSKTDAQKVGAATKGETRLIVAGANLASNDGAQYAETRDLFMNAVSYLVQDENFIAIRPKDPTKSSLNMATSQAGFLLLLLAWVYPMFFLGGGTLIWLRRRRA